MLMSAKTTFLDGYTLFYEEIPLEVAKVVKPKRSRK